MKKEEEEETNTKREKKKENEGNEEEKRQKKTEGVGERKKKSGRNSWRVKTGAGEHRKVGGGCWRRKERRIPVQWSRWARGHSLLHYLYGQPARTVPCNNYSPQEKKI